MESAKSPEVGLKDKKTNLYLYEHKSPLQRSNGIGKSNTSPGCSSLMKVNNYFTSPRDKENCEDLASSEPKYSTPLRGGCSGRTTSQCVDSCCHHSNGHFKTPVGNTRKTPLKVPVNPFDAVLLDRLHLPICSPSIFSQIRRTDDNEFRWSIDQQATLFPAPIEEELHVHHHMYEQSDPEVESRIQKAIDIFYESTEIAPSPWVATEKKTLAKGGPNLTARVTDILFEDGENHGFYKSTEIRRSPETRDACTQTQLSLPFRLPAELESLLQKYMLPEPPKEEVSSLSSTSIMEYESFISSSLRRKLFSHMEEMSISQTNSAAETERPSSPLQDKSFSSPAKSETIFPELHHSVDTEDEESLPDFLESSQTRFWQDRSSPSLSPIGKESPSKSPAEEKQEKSMNEEMFTPPSSRTRHNYKPIFPLNFAPLLEKVEEKEDDDAKRETGKMIGNVAGTSMMQDKQSPPKGMHCTDYFIKSCLKGEKSKGAQENFVNSAFFQSSSHKFALNAHRQQSDVMLQDRVHFMEVSDCGNSKMQDTGYQTVSMNTLPSSVSLSSSKNRDYFCSFPLDAVSLSEKRVNSSKMCDDGYTSLTSMKLPHMPEYDDESMCDVWHTSPSPIASSTPAKHVTGFLM